MNCNDCGGFLPGGCECSPFGGRSQPAEQAPCRKCGAKRGEPCVGDWTTCEGSAAHRERNASRDQRIADFLAGAASGMANPKATVETIQFIAEYYVDSAKGASRGR